MTRARNSANLASHGNLFVDIANDRTGIGSVVPDQNLHVAGTAGFHADVTFTGDLYNTTWDRSANSLRFNDSAQIKLGTGNDANIRHDGNNTWIQNGTGYLYIDAAGSSSGIRLISHAHWQAGAMAAFYKDGGVQLFHDASSKFTTEAYGTNTTGTAVNDGLVVAGVATVTTMNVTGVLTYDDVTSVDSIGIVTARQGVRVKADGGSSSNYISAGASDDLKIWHDGGTASIIKTKTGDQLSLQSDLFWVRNSANSESIIKGTADGAVQLYHNNIVRLETGSSHVNQFGTFNSYGTGNGEIRIHPAANHVYTSVKFYTNAGASNASILCHGGSTLFLNTTSQIISVVSGTEISELTSTGFNPRTSSTAATLGQSNKRWDNVYADAADIAGDLKITDSIVHAGDTNTKIRFPSNDTIQFETGGTTMVGITTRTAISSHTGTANAFGQLSVNTSGTGDGIAFYIGAHAAIPSTHASGNATTGVSTAIYVQSSYAKRPEIRFDNSHSGNWHDSPGNTSHLRMVWTTKESSTTPEVVDIHPRVAGNAGGAFDGLRIRVTDNSNGLRNCLFLQHDNQYFHINNPTMVQISSDGLGINDSLYHRGDTNTKIRFPAADTITAETAGTERLRITSAGDLGLGINNPARHFHLHVDSSLANYQSFTNSTTGASSSDGLLLGINSSEEAIIWNYENTHLRIATNAIERLRIKSDGLVGIGIETPQRLLHQHIASSGATYHAFTNSTTGSGIHDGMVIGISGSEEAIFWNYEATPMRFATSGAEQLRIDANGNMALGKGSASSTNYGTNFQIHSSGTNGAALHLTDGTTGGGTGDGFHIISTSGHAYLWNRENAHMIFATNGTERVRIASNGRMGIGNNNPQFMIHTEGSGNNGGIRFENSHTTTTVSGNTAAGAFPHNLILSNYGGSGNADNRLVSLGFDIPTTVSHANAQIVYQATGSGGQGDLQFWLENGNTTYERARFTAAGQFVMGTTSSTGARVIIQQDSSDTNPLDQQTCADSSGMRLQNYSFSTGRFTALSMECCNSSSVQSASIIAQSVASGTSPDIIIAQRTSNTANSERLRIRSDGTIRVGGAGPTEDSLRLILNNPSADNSQMQFQTNATGNSTTDGLRVGYNGSGGQMWLFENEYLRFATSNNERLRIHDTGAMTHFRSDNTTRFDLEFRQTGGISNGNYGGIRWSQNSTGGVHLASMQIAYTDAGRPHIVFNHRNRGGGTTLQEVMRLKNDGDVSIADGNLVIGTSGHGIDFSASGNASEMTSELLDDYEEGTFIPELKGTSGGGTLTGSSAASSGGNYTKIGNKVFLTFYFANPTGSNPSGTLYFELPHTVAGNNNSYGDGGAVTYHRNIDPSGNRIFAVNAIPSTNRLYIARVKQGGQNETVYQTISHDSNLSSMLFKAVVQYVAA